MNTPTCRICSHQTHWLVPHLQDKHSLSEAEYLAKYPGEILVSDKVRHTVMPSTGRQHPPVKLMTKFAGFPVAVNSDVESDACLMLPDHYRTPTSGQLAEDVKAAAISLIKRRKTYIWGQAGAGKDAIIQAFSYYTQTPAKMFQIDPTVDIRPWFFSHEIVAGQGTVWHEGELLKALRDGYKSPTTGRVIPYLILITDFDRATKAQAESMRLVMDSIQGRVMGPNGVVYTVLPGTQIVVTANSAGSGDSSGRYGSSNVIDASIMDRFERCFQFHWMDWADEGKVVSDKFPLIAARAPWIFERVGKCTESLRVAISTEQLFGEFSHRAVCAWLGHTQDMIEFLDPSAAVPSGILSLSFRAYEDKLSDTEARQTARRLIDPLLAGGAVNQGSTSHVGSPAPAGGRLR